MNNQRVQQAHPNSRTRDFTQAGYFDAQTAELNDIKEKPTNKGQMSMDGYR